MRTRTRTRPLLLALVGLAIPAAFTGCETKREVLDIETPDGGIEINENSDGSIEIETGEAARD